MSDYTNVTSENLETEHLCCAIADKKHQTGVNTKRAWLTQRLPEGHTFRKLNAKGKVFIEYAPLEAAWVPVLGDNYLYIYCLWVSGSFKGKGHAKALLEYCVADAKKQGKSGVCILSASKKTPYLSEKKFLVKAGFEAVDSLSGGYELMALSFDSSVPRFADTARKQGIDSKQLTIYYGMQCPYIPNCIEQVKGYCEANAIPVDLIPVDTLEKAKAVPGMFNNWAVFKDGKFETVHLLNEGYLKKLLGA